MGFFVPVVKDLIFSLENLPFPHRMGMLGIPGPLIRDRGSCG
jgi:hypothetical protein